MRLLLASHRAGTIALVVAALFSLTLLAAANSSAGVISPRDGASIPEELKRLLRNHRDSGIIAPEHRWADRRKDIPFYEREDPRLMRLSAERPLLERGGVLSGVLNIPVIMGLFSGVSSSIDSVLLEKELFTGPWNSGTMREYYLENSGGLLEVTGEVLGWRQLDFDEVYYSGGFGSWGLDPGAARTGEYIQDAVLSVDGFVDFGDFDNDGPDGVPNSGDDDGYVDVLILVTPTMGAECDDFSNHFWSHSWRYSAWNDQGGPLSTADPSASGGMIKVEDYIIVPSISCDASAGSGSAEDTIIEIGVFCHELGHSLGLVDLYDTGYYGTGIGYWGLMGYGAWNKPESPAHLCAWSKERLGWVDVIEAGYQTRTIAVEPVARSRTVVKMEIPVTKFSRRECPLGSGEYSLLCGCGLAEASSRDWPRGAGYGNGWNESVKRSFDYSSSSPCVLTWDLDVDIEEGFDYGYLVLEVNGAEDTLAAYTGRISIISESIDLSEYLPPPPGTFTLRFDFASDYSVSDEDGEYDSDGCSVFRIDNIEVSGSGIDYFCDFQSHAGGWRYVYPGTEYFLASNRSRAGFDRYLLEEGLLIWHADNYVAYSALANTGGTLNGQARGVVLEEADGRYDLLYAVNNVGDKSDPYPGLTGNTSFGLNTSPNSRSNGGNPTPVSIENISFSFDNISADYTAGFPAPHITGVFPQTIDKEGYSNSILIEVTGLNIRFTPKCVLKKGRKEIPAGEVVWLGQEKIIADFDSGPLTAGYWDLHLENPDGNTASLQEGLFVNSIYLYARAFSKNGYIGLEWEVEGDLPCQAMVYRSGQGGDFDQITSEPLAGSGGMFSYRDTGVEPSTQYSYRIVTTVDERTEEILLAGPYQIQERALTLFQNHPNPFSDQTTLEFYLPGDMEVEFFLYDALGRRVDGIRGKTYSKGYNAVSYRPGRDKIPPGLYFLALEGGGNREVIKIVVIR